MNSISRDRRGGAARGGRAGSRRAPVAAKRLLRVEALEDRALMTVLPFGALPDDTGEFMLGDVRVNVVLMESDPTLAPSDNLPAPAGRGAPAANWTTETIAAVKAKIQAGMQWWEDTLDALPNVRDGLLDFTFNWTYADAPVRTGYEPIHRPSDDFVLWMYDFLDQVGFNQTANFSSDIRAYNNFTRLQAGADWAFTIFVVNDAADADGQFDPSGRHGQAFAYAGGQFMVVPAGRPISTYTHEPGHIFWAYDEYQNSASYSQRRGYYNTQNTNAIDGNPNPTFVQADSIMAIGTKRQNAFAANTSSQPSLEMIGWRDSDSDGIFDVLDVPFTLTGTGRLEGGQYRFSGSSEVRTLPNRNSSGLQNDITINQVRILEMSLDDAPWTTVQTFPARTYKTTFDVSVAAPAGDHVIKFRTADPRTGVTSPAFVGSFATPTSTPVAGISGFVFRDANGNGLWDAGETPIPDLGVEVEDSNGSPLDLQGHIEPSEWPEETLLNQIEIGAALTVLGGDTANTDVLAKTSTRAASAGRVFASNSITANAAVETWNFNRQLRVNFQTPVGAVSLRAYGATVGAPSYGRLEAYNSSGALLERFTTSALTTGGAFATMSIARPGNDIAYVIARGHAGTEVVLDSLVWGPTASLTTNVLGAYSLAALPPGTYRVKVTPPPQHVITSPSGGVGTVTIAAAGETPVVNFGVHFATNPWHNFYNRYNVDNDPNDRVQPLDALMVINYLNANLGNFNLPPERPPGAALVDVDNNGRAQPLDALMVINELNRRVAGGGGGGEGETSSSYASSGAESPGNSLPPAGAAAAWLAGDAGAAEGEQPPAPRSAAEYYAQNPHHFAEIPGADLPCCCGNCLAVEALAPSLETIAERKRESSTAADAFPPTLSLELRHERRFRGRLSSLRRS